MCEIITIVRRLAHASSLTYRFWGDASREESLFGVTPRAKASPQKMRGVTPKNARRHPNACEESPRKWRDGPSPVFRK